MCSLLDELLLPEPLIADLSQSLPYLARVAFRQAALEAMARLEIVGPGSLYRVLAQLQAEYFDPPADERGPKMQARVSKLIDQPAIEHARRGPQGRPLPVV